MMNSIRHLRITGFAVLLSICAVGLTVSVGASDEPVDGCVEGMQRTILGDDESSGSDATYLVYHGTGSVSVLGSGFVVIHVDRENPPRPDGSALGGESQDAYVLWVDVKGFSLVDSAGEWFLDRGGAALDHRGLAVSEVSIFPLSGKGATDPGNDDTQTLVHVKGDLMLELAPDADYAYFEVWDADGSNIFQLEIASSHENGSGVDLSILRPLFSFCGISCPPHGGCMAVCPFGTAHCECDPITGEPHCWCTGGFDLHDVDVHGMILADVECIQVQGEAEAEVDVHQVRGL